MERTIDRVEKFDGSVSIKCSTKGTDLQVQVKAATAFEEPRPVYWARLRSLLNTMAFQFLVGEDEEGEFMPTTFFSAAAILSAVKTYPQEGRTLAARDIRMIGSCVGAKWEGEDGAGAGVSGWIERGQHLS
jgi:hypothetical protein